MLKEHENCWFLPGCSIKDEHCDSLCLRYEHCVEAFKLSGLSESQQKIHEIDKNTEDRFLYNHLDQIRKTMPSWCETFNSYYFWSEGYLNGKTTWAIKFLQYYILLTSDSAYNNYLRAYFCRTQELKELHSLQYSQEKKDDYRLNRKKIIEAEVLVIDDIETIIENPKLSQFVGEILNERYELQKSVIFTSHLSPEDFEKRCSNGLLKSRVIDLSTPLHFSAPPYKIDTKEVK